jgi:EAL domain-containing protein (putative c-di-GMP-specific phosphodiesterase class I)
MERLAESGVRFALDDFGIHQSSLSQLSGLPFSTLKIDRSFMHRITEDRGQAALVHAIISMAHAFGMRAIAEGVEQAEQMIFLQAYGCEMAQGYLFSPPVPAASLEAVLTAGSIGVQGALRAEVQRTHDGKAA